MIPKAATVVLCAAAVCSCARRPGPSAPGPAITYVSGRATLDGVALPGPLPCDLFKRVLGAPSRSSTHVGGCVTDIWDDRGITAITFFDKPVYQNISVYFMDRMLGRDALPVYAGAVKIQDVTVTSQSTVDDLRAAGLAPIEPIHHPEVFNRDDGGMSVVAYVDPETGRVDMLAVLFPVPVGGQ